MIKVVQNPNALYRTRKLSELHTGVEFVIDKSCPIRYTKTASDGVDAIIKTVSKGDKSIYSLNSDVYVTTQESTFAQIDIGTVFSVLSSCDNSKWIKVSATFAYNINRKYPSNFLDITQVIIHGILEHT